MNSDLSMGDNRKGSGVTQGKLAFFNIMTSTVLPLEKQKGVLDKKIGGIPTLT
jgi:hypothetical protein